MDQDRRRQQIRQLQERNRQLVAVQQRLHHILDGTADAILVVDADGIVKFANRAAVELFERGLRDLIDGPFGLPVVTGETTEVDLPGGRVAEMRALKTQWVERPAWVASLRDVTERKAAEEAARHLAAERAARKEVEKEHRRLVAVQKELESAMQRLRQEDRRKDQFMAVLGHELRNPLAGLDSGLRLLERGVDTDRAGWAREMMRRQVDLLKSLLDDLLDVSRVARGKLELRLAVVNVCEVVQHVLDAARPRLDDKRQQLELELPDEPLQVEADRARLVQVLNNLLVNASKYTGEGGSLAVAVRCRDEEAEIEVSDQGVGIDAEMLDEIFEPFLQAGGGAASGGGLGIGLTLVKQLVELHGGSVHAASPGPGDGSTFTVRLPLAPAGACPEPAPDHRDVVASCAGRRVLVVDDNESAARALGELLTLSGCRVALAADGAEALEQAAIHEPEVVLLDLDLPDISGYEVAERLRAAAGTADSLIVAVSGFGNDAALERAARAGFDRHLVKPVDLDELLRLISTHGPARPDEARAGGEAGPSGGRG